LAMLPLVIAAVATTGTLGLILYSVITNNKAIGALIQLGDIQRRKEVHQERKTSPSPSPSPTATTVSERISFTIGVMNACLTCYLIGAAPTKFYLWYTPKAIVLIFARWYDFRSRKQHYLLYDFCYWANALTLLYLWVFPHDPTLFQIVFLCANGPLAWSILAFNQSLVFHKCQQIVSVFIHISPMMVTFGLRWNDSHFSICDDFPNCQTTSVLDMLWKTMTRFYLWWIVLYYLWIFIYLGKYLQSRSYTTLYDRVTNSQMKFLFSEGGAVGHYPHLVKKAIYMMTHVLFGLFTMSAACIWWQYYWAHLLFIITIATMSAYNASLHYNHQFLVEVDAKKAN